MRVLVLTFYFPPDLSAGSFRTGPLVEALKRRLPAHARIDVVTTLPNRYRSFSADAPEREVSGNVSITRIRLPTHRSGMFDQARAFITFARGAASRIESGYDLVFATSSRLMTAVLGAWAARRTGAPLYLDIRDIFADTIREVASPAIATPTAPLFNALERWAVKSASHVNLVSRGFGPYFAARYPRQRFSFHTNGIDPEFIALAESTIPPAGHGGSTVAHVVYAGNIGEGQGLHTILPPLAAAMGSRVRFTIAGDGGRREALERALEASGVTNVTLLPPMTRPELLDLYASADVMFVHLNDYAALRKVLPSKVFEYAASRRPIWAGVAGFAAEFLRGEVPNVGVFEPCDVAGAVRAFDQLALEYTPREEFIDRYSREAISRRMASEMAQLVDGTITADGGR